MYLMILTGKLYSARLHMYIQHAAIEHCSSFAYNLFVSGLDHF